MDKRDKFQNHYIHHLHITLITIIKEMSSRKEKRGAKRKQERKKKREEHTNATQQGIAISAIRARATHRVGGIQFKTINSHITPTIIRARRRETEGRIESLVTVTGASCCSCAVF